MPSNWSQTATRAVPWTAANLSNLDISVAPANTEDQAEQIRPAANRLLSELQDHLTPADRDHAPAGILASEPATPTELSHNRASNHTNRSAHPSRRRSTGDRSVEHWLQSLDPQPSPNTSPGRQREANADSSPSHYHSAGASDSDNSDSDDSMSREYEHDILHSFEYGVDDDPLEYLYKIENSCLGRSISSSNTVDTHMMDMARKGCCRFLQSRIGVWTHTWPGGGKDWYAKDVNGRPDAAHRPTWEEFKKLFCRQSLPGEFDIKSLARKQARKLQTSRAPQHIQQHVEKTILQGKLKNEKEVRDSTDTELRDEFRETVADQMIPVMARTYPGQDARSQLEKDSVRNKTLGEDYVALEVIDQSLAKLCKKLTKGKTSNYLMGGAEGRAAAVVQEAKDEVHAVNDTAAAEPVDDKLSKMEARFESRFTPLEKSVGELQATTVEMGLGQKQIDTKLDRLIGSMERLSAPQAQQPWQNASEYQQTSYQSKGGKGKGGKGKTYGKGKGKSYGRTWYQPASNTPRTCWNCGLEGHLMRDCKAEIQQSNVNVVNEGYQQYEQGGTDGCSSWDIVEQFSDVNYLNSQWDWDQNAYSISEDLETHAHINCVNWIQMCKECNPGAGEQQWWDKLADKICGVAQTALHKQDVIEPRGDNKVAHPEGCECMQITIKGQTVQRVASVQQGSRQNNNVEHQPCSATQSPANSDPGVERQLGNSGEAGGPVQAHNQLMSSETSVVPEAISGAELQMANSEHASVVPMYDSLKLPVASVAVILTPEVHGCTQLTSGDSDVYVAANVKGVDMLCGSECKGSGHG